MHYVTLCAWYTQWCNLIFCWKAIFQHILVCRVQLNVSTCISCLCVLKRRRLGVEFRLLIACSNLSLKFGNVSGIKSNRTGGRRHSRDGLEMRTSNHLVTLLCEFLDFSRLSFKTMGPWQIIMAKRTVFYRTLLLFCVVASYLVTILSCSVIFCYHSKYEIVKFWPNEIVNWSLTKTLVIFD